MAAVVRMPAVAAGAAEAAVQAWLVAVGDSVEPGQPIVEIETEKAIVEYEAESGGTIAGILVEAGAAAAVGAPIAVIAEAGESVEGALRDAGLEDTPAGDVEAVAERRDPESGSPVSDSASSGPAAASAAADSAPPIAASPAGRARLAASPLVRRLARERGIDLTSIAGTGPGGRIVRRDLDVLAAGAAAAAASEPAASPTADFVDIPHTPLRRAIARRLTESVSSVPHFFLTADCVVDELLELRAKINATTDITVSVNDLVLKAVATAMKEVPEANAIWTENAMRRFAAVDIAVAVAVPGGVLTPVVRGVDALSLRELSATVRELADRARNGRLKQHELEGGTFSVSNLGMYGTRQFSAIINPPHAGILAVGTAGMRPVARDDGTLAAASVLTVTLSADHRVLDGASAAQWLDAFRRSIENPLGLLV